MPAGLFAFADLLHGANRRAGRPLFEVAFAAVRPGIVECAHGVSLEASRALDDVELDALLVPGFWAESAQQVAAAIRANTELVSALAACSGRLQLWSYCSGVCLLAASGCLNGKAATVTWWLADAMAQHYDKVRWQSERNCVAEPQAMTASGVNGYLPIAQALIERQASAEVARELDRLMILPRPVQPHSAFRAMSLIEQPSPLLGRLHALVEQWPAEQVTVSRLAEQLGLSERTLARKVHGETGVSVAAYARCIKLNQVSERLIYTSAPLARIGAELGFSSDSNLSRMFKDCTGLTPLEYRNRYGRY
jgi:transcriptional regulator GlxA family with amidase domain